ncbi:hypothetical protein C8J57DRAFT_996996, partial [Mycena rebaudengoi]
IWYSDGNTVLHAGSVLFKVYKGLLAEKSPVLENRFILMDLISPPSLSTDISVLIEGCPIMVLDDNPQDLEYFVK